jgi:outer membrane receptor protein involved in Fe transport
MRRNQFVTRHVGIGLCLLGLLLCAPGEINAQDSPNEESTDQSKDGSSDGSDVAITLPEVIVSGERAHAYRTESRTEVTSDAAALPAPTTILDSKDIQRTPILNSYVDLFRPLPGFNVNNLGQGGIGNGIAIRGFTDLEHGRDVAYFIDGIPINEVSSIHTPNYADLNILVPETVERLEVVRGPFSALYGDSNLGGSVNIVTKRFESTGEVKGYGGYFNTGRGIVTYSHPRAEESIIVPYLAAEAYTTDGYRDNQGYRRYNLFGKATAPTKFGDFTIRTQFYGGDWGAPGYLNRNLVQSGVVSPTTAFNGTDGGNKEYQNVTLNYGLGDLDQAFTVTAFANHDTFTRWADFGGGQREQDENRTTVGATIRKTWTGQLFSLMPAQLLVGTNFRNDSVGVAQLPTVARIASGPDTVNLNFTEQGLGEYIQAQINPAAWVKLTGGTRYDHFWYNVDNHLPTSSVPLNNTGVWSPKAGIALTPVSWLEIFANYGEGFRSPSAVDNVVSSTTAQPIKLRSREAGVQIRPSPRFKFLADVWYTTLSQEIFQPTAGLDPQNLGSSIREGYDIEARYYVRQDKEGQASVFVNYTQIRAVLTDGGPARFVPNVPSYFINIGTDVDIPIGGVGSPHRAGGQLYLQFIGKKNLTEDGTFTTNPYQRIASRVFYAHESGWTGFVDVIWYPTDRLSETALNFGNPTGASSSDIFVNPQAPFALMVGLSYRFKTAG